MRRRPLAAFAGIVLAGLALTACATSAAPDGSGDGSAAPGAGDTGAGVLQVGAAWLAGGSSIAVVTEGSSSCRPNVEDAVVDQGVLVVTLTEKTGEDQVCTDDLVKRGTLVGIPEGVQPGTGLDIQVTLDGAFGETSLDDYTGGAVEEYTPSAGRVDDHTVALLTWGSSSCAPQVESATAVTPDEVQVTFAQPAADQVCTMDMAPRVSVVTVEGDIAPDATISLGVLGERPGGSIPID